MNMRKLSAMTLLILAPVAFAEEAINAPAPQPVPPEKIHALWETTPQRQRECIEMAYKELKPRCLAADVLKRLTTEAKQVLPTNATPAQKKTFRQQMMDPFLTTALLCSFRLNQDVDMAENILVAALAKSERLFMGKEGGFAEYQHAGGPSREATLFLHCRKSGDWPARLAPATERQMLEYFWHWVYRNSQIAYPRAPRIENVWLDTFEGLGGGSENHRTTKWSALLLTLTALADDPAYAKRKLEDGATVQEHLVAWTDYLEYRMREWARKGLFGEFGKAAGYGAGHIEPLYSLRDFASTAELRRLADDLLTLRVADWMMNMIGPGYVGGSAIRSYKGVQLQHYREAYLYFALGRPDLAEAGIRNIGVDVKEPYSFFSGYRPPEILVDLAWNRAAAGPYEYWMKPSGVVGWGSFFYGRDNVKLEATTNQPTAGPTFPTPTLRYAYVTPGYVLGSFTQDPTRDPTYAPAQPPKPLAAGDWGLGFQDIIMGVAFPAGYQLALRCREPDHSGFGEFRAVADRSVLIAQRNSATKSKDLGIYFPLQLFETKCEADGWVCARDPNGTAFIAIKPAKGGIAGWEPLDKKPDDPKLPVIRGQWLKFTEQNVPIVIQLGLASDYKDFTAFIAAVKARPFRWRSETEFEYAGCGTAHPIVWNTERRYLPLVGGVPLNIYPPHVYQSPYLESVYDSGLVTLRDTRGKELVLNFNKSLAQKN
ncbi:MAG: hypothetical protein NTY53_25795 [Kiritimatiellaeota bacterium]|nr:hypothetical protein [Kiritimatiellota bacterium]